MSIEVLVQSPTNYLIFVLKWEEISYWMLSGRIDKGSEGEAPWIFFDIYAVMSSNLMVCWMKYECKKKIMITEVNDEGLHKYFLLKCTLHILLIL